MERQPTERTFAMSDDHDHLPADAFEQPDDRPGDWDPMGPETTLPESPSDEAAREEEHQLETGEENPT